MQRTLAIMLERIGQPAGRRYVGRGLILLSLAASLLPLSGCEGMVFPWDEEPQPQVSEAIQIGGPSVTRGRPETSQPAVKPKPKAKTKKPAAPANPPSVAQQTSGPEIAAEPGLPANDASSSPGDASADAGTAMANTDNTPRDSGVAPGTNQTGAAQTASLPNSEADHAPVGQPSDMIGRDESGIRSMIGNPTKTHTEGSTTVWSYEKDGCVLDLFLFYDVKTGAQRVLSYEIKPNATDNNAIQACYNKFHNV
jgi:hypothetical protein